MCAYFDQKCNYLCRIVYYQRTSENALLPLLPERHPDPCGLLMLVVTCRQADGAVATITSVGAFCCSCATAMAIAIATAMIVDIAITMAIIMATVMDMAVAMSVVMTFTLEHAITTLCTVG